MARPICVIVSDDYNFLQKARAWGQENNATVHTYSPTQWAEGLDDPHFKSNLIPEGVTLSSGTSMVSGGGKILPFPSNGRVSEDGKRVATMEELESVAIRNAISEYKGNLTEAAKALGIGRATLYRKVKQYRIDPSFARKAHRAA